MMAALCSKRKGITMDDNDAAVTSRRVDELLDLVGDVVGSGSVTQEPMVAGQRVLMRLIPFAEPLGRNGPARRQVLVSLVDAAVGRTDNPQLLFALRAVQQVFNMGLDSVIVDALQDTRLLAQSAMGCGACLLSVFMRFFRRHSPRN